MKSQYLIIGIFLTISSLASGFTTSRDKPLENDVTNSQLDKVELKSYNGCQVHRVTPLSPTHLQTLKEWEESAEVLFWEGPTKIGRHADVLLCNSPVDSVRMTRMQRVGMKIETFINDVGKLLEEQKVYQINSPVNSRLSWDRYYQVADINLFLRDIAANHSNVASVFSIGRTTEGRDMNIIKISKSAVKKPVIFIDANIHAREWITSAVATYLINDLLTSSDPIVQKWTEDYDWYVLPVVNPDGLEYTHTTDRMWRKSRSNTSSPLGCKGADLNRNFDYHWMQGGASTNPCSETFGGASVFSEPESVNVANFVRNTISEDVKLYISLHSYSQFIMFPYGDTANIPNYEKYMEITREAADAIYTRFNTRFLPGNWLDILYLSTGTSMDWVQTATNVSISLTYELRDQGRYGFILPANQIEPSAMEFIDSLVPIMNQLSRLL